VAVAALLAAACAAVPRVPPTPGWDQLRDDEVVVDELERTMWERSVQSLAPLRPLLIADPRLDTYVQRVLTRITPGPLPTGAPTPAVHIIRASDRFAAALPNGAILVTTSYLAALDNEAQLAGLLGHEVAHFLGRHAFIERRYAATSSSTVLRMRLSRKHEDAADAAALALVRRAGYDPREVVAMLALAEEDDQAGRTAVPEWEGHPYMADRLQTLRRDLAGIDATGTVVGRETYEEAIADILVVAAEAELASRHFDRARTIIDRHLRLRPASGRGYFLLAEHARMTEPDGYRSPTARHHYERAVELAPRDPDAVRALGLLYRETGDHERARPLFRTYLRIAGAAPDRKLIERYLAESRR